MNVENITTGEYGNIGNASVVIVNSVKVRIDIARVWDLGQSLFIFK